MAVDALNSAVWLSRASRLELFLKLVSMKEVVTSGGGACGGSFAGGGGNSKGMFVSSERARFICILNWWDRAIFRTLVRGLKLTYLI